MFKWIGQLLFHRGQMQIPANEDQEQSDKQEFIWCLVGNIIPEYHAPDGKIYNGIKHFSGNTKVYCFPPAWGDGYQNIKVIGRHRKSSKKHLIIIQSKFVYNWRLQKVFDPFVIRLMKNNCGWKNTESDRQEIEGLAAAVTAWAKKREK